MTWRISGLLLLVMVGAAMADTYDNGTLFWPDESNVTYNLTEDLECGDISVGALCLNISSPPAGYAGSYCKTSATPITIDLPDIIVPNISAVSESPPSGYESGLSSITLGITWNVTDDFVDNVTLTFGGSLQEVEELGNDTYRSYITVEDGTFAYTIYANDTSGNEYAYNASYVFNGETSGGVGGSGAVCLAKWECSEWSPCEDKVQTRICDLKTPYCNRDMPEIRRECYIGFDFTDMYVMLKYGIVALVAISLFGVLVIRKAIIVRRQNDGKR